MKNKRFIRTVILCALIAVTVCAVGVFSEESAIERPVVRRTDGKVYEIHSLYDVNTGEKLSTKDVAISFPAELLNQAALYRATAVALEAKADSLALLLGEPAPKATVTCKVTNFIIEVIPEAK